MMSTGATRYRQHKVWETLQLKLDALKAARFDKSTAEQWRKDIIEWLEEAKKTKVALQPALYLSALDDLSNPLNGLPTTQREFQNYVDSRRQPPQGVWELESALRALPLPPPKQLKASYTELLDNEIEMRTEKLDELKEWLSNTESSLNDRKQELSQVRQALEGVREDLQKTRDEIGGVTADAQKQIDEEWREHLQAWERERETLNNEHNSKALEHVSALAAIAVAGKTLAEHAAGDLSASDWYSRAKRERRSAQWIRAFALAAFAFAAVIGFYIVREAIDNKFDLTLGDGILRSAVAIVISAFGALLIKESSRHFREADTAEDVALALSALAPFFADSEDNIRLAARVQLGDAVLVKNVLSRFAHRDAARHGGQVSTTNLPDLVADAVKALNLKRGETQQDGNRMP